MPVEAAVVSYVLSSVASVGRILESTLSLSKVGKKLTEAEFDALVVKASARVAENQNNAPPPAQIHAAMTKEIVQDIEGEMSKIREKMKKIVTDPTIAPEQRVKDLESTQNNTAHT